MYMYDDYFLGGPDEVPNPKKKGFGTWLKNAGKDLGDFISGDGAANTLNTVNQTLCVINPKRPGCNQQVIYAEQQRQNTLWVVLLVAVLIGLFVFLILKKKK
jgi:hypothetical protein